MKYSPVSLFVVLLTFSSVLFAHSGATGVVKERMDYFKESKASIKLLKSAVKNKDFDTIAREAASINKWALQLTSLFPKGSNQHPSEALDLIWKEFSKFEVRAQKQIVTSDRLHKAALAGDAKASAKAFSELANSCKACHDEFRE